MTTDYRALCAELLEDADELADLMQGVIDGDYAPDSLTLQPIKGSMARARTALAQSEPVDDRVAELEAELERERLRLAACGVVAMADTPESAARARDMHPDYRSASLDDVIRQVDALMELRTALAQPEPVGPTDEELLFWAHFYGIDYVDIDRPSELDAEKAPVRSDELRIFARAVLTRWGRPAIEPVPGQEGK